MLNIMPLSGDPLIRPSATPANQSSVGADASRKAIDLQQDAAVRDAATFLGPTSVALDDVDDDLSEEELVM